MEKIGVGYAYVSDREKQYVNEALDAGRLSQGDMVNRFEKEFARLHEQKYGIACNSGTSALHVALECLAEKYGWGKGGGGRGLSACDYLHSYIERMPARKIETSICRCR